MMNLLRRYPGTPPGPCCPIQSVTALADKLPSSIGLDIINDSAENSWTVGYTGNATVDHLNVQGADYPSMAAYNAPDATQTVSSFNADVTKVPTRVDVVAKLPQAEGRPPGGRRVLQGLARERPGRDRHGAHRRPRDARAGGR